MYQRETRLWPQAGRCPDSRLGAFHLTHANIDLRLLAEDVTKQGGGGLQWVGSREREFSAPLPRLLSSSSPYPEESDSGGVSSPRLPPPRALTVARPALQSHILCLRACCLLLLTRLASRLTTTSGKVVPRGALCTYPRHYIRTCMC
jgi:hypothetical protein